MNDPLDPLSHQARKLAKRLRETAFIQDVKLGDLEKVKSHQKAGFVKMDCQDSMALSWAAEFGYLELVEFLIPFSVNRYDNTKALLLAVQKNHMECVKKLLPVSEPLIDRPYILDRFVKLKQLEALKILLPLSDPSACNYEALTTAIRKGWLEGVEVLMSDPRGWGEECGYDLMSWLKLAHQTGHEKVENFLRAKMEHQEIHKVILSPVVKASRHSL